MTARVLSGDGMSELGEREGRDLGSALAPGHGMWSLWATWDLISDVIAAMQLLLFRAR